MSLRLLLVAIFLFCVLPPVLLAQGNSYLFSKVGAEQGLSHHQVYAIYRDSTGFVWFGTASGLNRFDGYNCKVFVNSPADSASLEDNYVTDIFPFPGGKLWIGSKSGGSVYDPLTEVFDRNFKARLKALSLPQSRIVQALADNNGTYWMLFEKEGLYQYSAASGKAQQVPAAQSGPGIRPTGISIGTAKTVWVIFSNGYLAQIDGHSLKKLQQTSVLQNELKTKAADFRVFADRQQSLWAYINGEAKGLFKINGAQKSFIRFHTGSAAYRLNDNLIKDLVQDNRGTIWAGTDRGGINLIDEADNATITYLVNKEHDRNSLGYNSIERMYADAKGLVWIGTGKKGVNYVAQNTVQFELHQYMADKPGSLPYNDVNCFAEDRKGNIWIGTNGGGLIYFDRKAARFTQYLHDASNAASLSNNVIVSLCLDKEDKLWIGTYLGGLDVFDGKAFKHYRHNPADPQSIADDRIWHILEDHKGMMWIGTLQGGLNRFDKKTGKATRYHFDNGTPRPLHSNYVPVIREDRDGNLWIGTLEGVEVLNKNRTKITHYKHTASPASLSHQHILDIAEDKRGHMWIGTRVGLNVLNKKTGKISRFGTDNGLPDNTVLTITEDSDGHLWITTPKELCQLLVTENDGDISFEVRRFTESNNVQGRVFNEAASMLSSDGLIFVGGATGFNIIDPKKTAARKDRPGLVFTAIEIFNKEVAVGEAFSKNVILKKALPFAKEVVLDHKEHIFSIEFAALDFSGNNQYLYKLEGFNSAWMHAAGNSRKITYTNLDAGTYYFKVKASNSDGMWSEEKTLRIIIRPPFWQTPWAFLLYALFAAVILYVARRYTLEKARMRFEMAQQKREQERILALDAVKTKFFTNVSHEFRTPLSLILTPLDRIVHKTADPEQKKQLQLVQRNAKRLLNLVNQLLDFRKMEVQEFKLQPTEGEIIGFIKEICYSFSDVSEMKRIGLSFTTNVQSLHACFDKDKLEKILFNLLSNAFKYTPAGGTVAVNIMHQKTETADAANVQIEVADTGIGIAADKQDKIFERFFQNDVPANITNPGTGIGLAIAREFVKLHNGTIQVSSGLGKGSVFTIIIPVQPLGVQPPGDAWQWVPAQKPEVASAANPVQKNSTRPLILLVEDNDDFRFYLKDNLSPQYDVLELTNGQEAWEKLVEIKPDLIVSDVMMPFMDGIELTRRIKATASLAHIPVMLLTAVGDEEMQLESYELGVADFMTKPFTYEILASRIKNVLAQTRHEPQKLPKLIAVSPGDINVPPAEEQFLAQVLAVIEKNMSNAEFTVEELSREMFMHRAGMYRKLLSLTGLTPLEFIRSMRLKRGRQLLEQTALTISEIAYEVGFNNPKKFSQYFKEAFGLTPSQLKQQVKDIAVTR